MRAGYRESACVSLLAINKVKYQNHRNDVKKKSAVNPHYSVRGHVLWFQLIFTSLQAERTGIASSKEQLFFDVNAILEEQKKTNDQVTLSFSLAISTKPSVVKYNTTGTVTLVGKSDDIKKKLEVNPKF